MVTSLVGEQRQRGLKLKTGRFTALVDHAKWTMKNVADIVGVTERQTYRWQDGSSAIPRSAWKVLCDAAGVDMLEDDWRERPT